MRRAILTFSNGSTLVLDEGQIVIPISFVCSEEETMISYGAPYHIRSDIRDGLVSSIAELLCKYEFFRLVEPEDERKFYKSSAVVSIDSV